MKWIDVTQACDMLGIKRESLYAYVSRGLVRAQPSESDPRASLYAVSDIQQLAQRKRASRKRAAIAQGAIGWGDPVLDSAITHVQDGRLFYRDRDAIALSETATLEQVAALLWGQKSFFCEPQKWVHSPLSDAKARGYAFLASKASTAQDDLSVSFHEAGALLIGLSSALANQPTHDDGALVPAHQKLAALWKLSPKHGDIIRTALVLLADHELNPSTFAARVAASTRASFAACCMAGYATLTGPFHGEAAAHAVTYLKNALQSGVEAALDMAQHDGLTPFGIGHKLYPEGDPRARALLSALRPSPLLKDAIAMAEERAGAPANIDMALAALTVQFDLPETAPFILFATARMAGWLAHAHEQIEQGTPIRPRARYQRRL
jgi:citrate synthase